MSKFSFQNLVLGKGACFGFNKNGIEKNINKFAEKKHTKIILFQAV